MENKLNEILQQALNEINVATTQLNLNEIRAFYTGKKSPLGEIMKTLATATIEEKKTIGAASNKVKQEIELAISKKREELEIWQQERAAAPSLASRMEDLGHEPRTVGGWPLESRKDT